MKRKVRRRNTLGIVLAAIFLSFLFVVAADAQAQQTGQSGQAGGVPGLSIQFNQEDSPEQVSNSIKILLLLTVLSLAPSAIVMTTSFVRIMIVLGLLRQAIGTQQAPPGQVLAAMALFLTIFIMMPVFHTMNAEAIQPYLAEEISGEEAWEKGIVPLRQFMLKQTGEEELRLFADLSKLEEINSVDDLPVSVLVPSFMLSELKTAFQMGFLIYLPFLVIDLVIASTLMSMGMMMLPPMMISLPIKILFFVMADGWTLTVKGIVTSFSI